MCQHTSELQDVFGTANSNYQSNNASIACEAEPDFRAFSNKLIAAKAKAGDINPERGQCP